MYHQVATPHVPSSTLGSSCRTYDGRTITGILSSGDRDSQGHCVDQHCRGKRFRGVTPLEEELHVNRPASPLKASNSLLTADLSRYLELFFSLSLFLHQSALDTNLQPHHYSRVPGNCAGFCSIGYATCGSCRPNVSRDLLQTLSSANLQLSSTRYTTRNYPCRHDNSHPTIEIYRDR